MKLLKELTWSLVLVLILWLSYALSPFLDLASTQSASIPVFEEQAFCFAALPKQVVQSWLLEQQLESRDVAVQETLKSMALQFKNKRNDALADFHFDYNSALAFYLIACTFPEKVKKRAGLPGNITVSLLVYFSFPMSSAVNKDNFLSSAFNKCV
jgi:hypothetical protein